jgi:hypothetical protein
LSIISPKGAEPSTEYVIASQGELIADVDMVTKCPDPDDNKFLKLPFNGKATQSASLSRSIGTEASGAAQ